MGKTLLSCSGYEKTIATASTNYIAVGTCHNALHATESRRQTKFRAAGTLSELYIHIEANSFSGTTTFRLRKNTANGNQVVSIPTTTTGFLKDTTNTDSVAVNDLLSYSLVTTGTGSIRYYQINNVFEPTTSSTTYTPFLHVNEGTNGLTTASATRYLPFTGPMNALTSST